MLFDSFAYVNCDGGGRHIKFCPGPNIWEGQLWMLAKHSFVATYWLPLGKGKSRFEQKFCSLNKISQQSIARNWGTIHNIKTFGESGGISRIARSKTYRRGEKASNEMEWSCYQSCFNTGIKIIQNHHRSPSKCSLMVWDLIVLFVRNSDWLVLTWSWVCKT